MLIEFKTENYRSFGEERKLSMVAGRSRIHPDHVIESHGRDILTFSAIYGANASGKSNLIHAMRESRDKIVSNHRISRNSWNRMDDSNIGRTTGFEYVFSTESGVYAYGFELFVHSGIVNSEWLFDMTDGDKRVFERSVSRIESDLRDADYTNILDVLKGLVGEKSEELLLRTLVKMDNTDGSLFSTARETMSWFRECLMVTSAGEDVQVSFDPDRDSAIKRIMTDYDTGITDAGYEEIEYPPANLPNDLREYLEDGMRKGKVGIVRGPEDMLRFRYDGGYRVDRIVFEHNGKKFGFKEESDGTQRLYNLLPILEPGIRKGMTYVIDELDRSLHPLMVYRFVEDFLEMARDRERQLIITAHDTGLQDMKLLRRDEIWYTDRDLGGNTDLYSLEDFKERMDRRVERAYLDGRYGAIPRFHRYRPNPESERSAGRKEIEARGQQEPPPFRRNKGDVQEGVRRMRGPQKRDRLPP